VLKISNKSIIKYWNLGEISTILPFGTGHINDTYKVETETQDYILQRVNKNVFLTKELVANYEVLADGVKKYHEENRTKITPQILKTLDDRYHHIDKVGAAWRLVEFIPNSVSYDISPDPAISYEAAKSVGRYQLFLNTIKPNLIQDTIPNFHDLEGRLLAFRNACDTCEKQLFKNAEREIEKSKSFAFISSNLTRLLKNLPLRVTHNDTKLNNIIFDRTNWLVIDLDTVMKGYVMFDFGDMVRTFTSPAMEDEKDISKTDFRIEHFEALTRGYLEALKYDLNQQEKESLLPGALYIIYEQVLRFLTDYLNGGVYYKTAYPEHNLVRARTQLKLLSYLLDNEKELTRVVNSL